MMGPKPVTMNAARARWIALSSMAVFMLMVLHFGLTGALIGACVVYCGSRALARSALSRLDSVRAQQVAVGLVALTIVGIAALAGLGLVGFLNGGGFGRLLKMMAGVLIDIRPHLPQWAVGSLPASLDQTGIWLGERLQEHASTAQALGQDFLHGLGRIVIGMFLGGLIAVGGVGQTRQHTVLGRSLTKRAMRFAEAFGDIVSAQARIALVNALLTAIFLVGVLPMMGVDLPLSKTLIIITFLFGLVPVLGNLASNTAITLVALSVAPWVAAVALGYLVILHKLEYLLNARIVGGQIQARAWEVLAAMLVMEAVFGLPGIILAPILYAYFKREMQAVGWL